MKRVAKAACVVVVAGLLGGCLSLNIGNSPSGHRDCDRCDKPISDSLCADCQRALWTETCAECRKLGTGHMCEKCQDAAD